MKRYILIFSIVLLAMQVFAQHDEQVTVEGKYRPKVNKVSKLQLNPETPQPSYDLPSTEVNPMEAKQKFSLDLEKIAPTGYAAKNDKLVEPTKNFLMAGIGTRLSPIFHAHQDLGPRRGRKTQLVVGQDERLCAFGLYEQRLRYQPVDE